MPYLPVDMAVVVEVGPLIDNTDFRSLEEAIAYDETNMDVDLLKKSATSLTKTDITLTTGGTSDWTHKGSGYYEVEITAAQNDTEGSLHVVGLCDGVLPFESPVYTVVPQMVYNSLVAGSDKLEIDVNQVGGTAVPETSGKLHVFDDVGNVLANEANQIAMAEYVDTEVQAIKDKTDNLPASPAAVGSEMTLEDDAITSDKYDELTAFPIKKVDSGNTEIARTGADGDTLEDLSDEIAGVSAGDATEAKQDTIIASLTAAKGATFDGATDSLEAIRNRGDAAWMTGVTGGGSETWEFILTEDGSGEPVADAAVWVTADEEGEGEIIASGRTDNFGAVTFYLDAGTYYFWAEKAGWNFNNPYTQVVS